MAVNEVLNGDAMTEARELLEVSRDGYDIQHIKNPSEAVCMAAVNKSGYALQFIRRPSEMVCMAAVRQSCYAIQYIETQSEVICLTAVQQMGLAIKCIKNPSEAVCMAAVENNPSVVHLIRNPSEAVRIAAVKRNPLVLGKLSKTLNATIMATHLLHHPLSPHTPKEILDRAPEILEAYCHGLGDVYTIGLSIGMSSDDLSRTLQEWTESQQEVFHP